MSLDQSSTNIPYFPVTNRNTRNIGISSYDKKLELEEMRMGGFLFRKWDLVDVANLCLVIVTHVLAVCAPFVFDWGAFRLASVLTLFTALGVTLGYHRLLTHRSFKTPKWLEYFFAYCGTHSGERDPIFWVSTHKNHHTHADTERDLHSPIEGFWLSHIVWLCYNEYNASKCGESKSGEYSNVPELKAQWFYRFLHDTYFWHPFTLAMLLYVYGGLPYLAWGMGVRIIIVFYMTIMIGSVGHLWGERPYNTPDNSTNNWWLGVITLGEGWHNNHHAFPKLAQNGFEPWQFDFTWEVIKFLQLVGLATDVIKPPTDADKRRMSSLAPRNRKING